MKRECQTVEIIKYTVSREEIIEAVIKHAETDDRKTLLPEPAKVIGVPDEIVFIYEYPVEEPKQPKHNHDPHATCSSSCPASTL